MVMRKNAKKFAAFTLAISFYSSVGIGKAMDKKQYDGERAKAFLKGLARSAMTSLSISDQKAAQFGLQSLTLGILDRWDFNFNMQLRNQLKDGIQKVIERTSESPIKDDVQEVIEKTSESPKNVRRLMQEEIKRFNEDIERSEQEVDNSFKDYRNFPERK